MSTGCFFLVVGPSGAGKDSLMDGARDLLPKDQFIFARRVITRPPGMPGEDYESCTQARFNKRKANGEFLVTWQAHGYEYGLAKELKQKQAEGWHVIANGSRNIISELRSAVDNLTIIHVTAPTDILIQRLAKRGRETDQEIRERMARNQLICADAIPVMEVNNDSTLAEGIVRFVRAIRAITDNHN